MRLRLRELACMALVSFGWSCLATKVLMALLMPEHRIACLLLVTLACGGGGVALGRIWAKLAWPRRRRELLREWGMDDQDAR